ncbi:hypothetical protein [Spirosoma sordidisoli]|uniref:Uncharacterized protein n=1 Tax=Spirosoma sordidisoli TaxID=2502893 RepID=A0A4Q2UQ50_9BACT|nr:hypothetical protein [Spirosoma sordidisoli]RYC69760.1 hypothetical protein EQG79_14285 [Spirosoma sordidisoli]
MLTDQITAWLTSPDDYDTGLQLLRKTGYSSFTLTVLSMGADVYNRQRLETELRTWLEKQNTIRPAAGSTAPGPTRYAVDSSVPLTVAMDFVPGPHQAGPRQAGAQIVVHEPAIGKTAVHQPAEPDRAGQLRKQAGQLLDERAELKAQLRARMDEGNSDALMAARLPLALRVKAITRQLDDIYGQLDFLDQNGYLPLATDPAVEVDDRAALMNVRSYVSRYRAKLKKDLTPEQRQSAVQLLQQYEAEKQRLELKLYPKHDSHSTGQQAEAGPNHPDPFP